MKFMHARRACAAGRAGSRSARVGAGSGAGPSGSAGRGQAMEGEDPDADCESLTSLGWDTLVYA